MKLPLPIIAAIIGFCSMARGGEVVVEAHGLQVRVDGVSKDAATEVEAIVEEQAALTEDRTVTPPLADDLSFFVRQRYRELGYRDALLTWKVAGNTAFQFAFVFWIDLAVASFSQKVPLSDWGLHPIATTVVMDY